MDAVFSFILYFRVCTKRYIGYNRVCTKWWTTCKQGMYKLVYTPMYQMVYTPLYHLVATYKIKYIIKYIFILRKRKRKRKRIALRASSSFLLFLYGYPFIIFLFVWWCVWIEMKQNSRTIQTDNKRETKKQQNHTDREQGDALKAIPNCSK